MTLFFIAILYGLLLIASTKLMPFSAWWPALGLFAILLRNTTFTRKITSPALAFLLFASFIALQAAFLAPSYDAKAVLLACTLIFSYLFFSHTNYTTNAFRLVTVLSLIIVISGLILWLQGIGFQWGSSARADVLFGTPNTFATFINLFLAPLLAYYLLGKGNKGHFVIILLLFASLLAAQSRGGYLGLFASMCFFLVLVGPKKILDNCNRLVTAIVGFSSTIFVLGWYTSTGKIAWEGGSRLISTATEGDMSRMELLTVAFKTLQEHFPWGTGTFTFRYYLEMFKPFSWQDRHTSFVHNDYAQIAVENGLVGITLFLVFIISLYLLILKHRKRIASEEAMHIIIPSVAIASMLAHAVVDFPFYVPVFQAILGAYVGVMNRHLLIMGTRNFELPDIMKWLPTGLTPTFIKNLTILSLIIWLGLPFIARQASDFSVKKLVLNDFENAVYWQSFASLLQPRVSEYYWREGVIWRDLGATRRNPAMMQKSDALFAKGAEVNPHETINLIYRVALWRQYSDLLKEKKSRAEIEGWMLRAKKQEPIGIDVQVEYIRFLAAYGPQDEAIRQAEILLHWKPNATIAKKILAEVKAKKKDPLGDLNLRK